MSTRSCRRSGCSSRAKATLTFSYADRTVVVGPLSPGRSEAGQDLCLVHSQSLTVPRGWELLRLPLDQPGQTTAEAGDLRALADAVREAAGIEAAPAPPPAPPISVVTLAERRHLRMVVDAERQARSGLVGSVG
ncbi:MAG: DUF3499 domain-containing protein [Propionibacteriaceae bacterium]|nr:DUF3499 domain-containing protein [Propionibacteriaceae bacterium]